MIIIASHSGDVDFQDFLVFARNFGKTI